MHSSENDHQRYIFEKVQAAIDVELSHFAEQQEGLDHEKLKREVRKVLAAYLRSKQIPSMNSDEEYWNGLQQFMEAEYLGNSPKGEYEVVNHIIGEVKTRLGWDQISDSTIPDG